MSTAESAQQLWWLLVDGAPTGPFSQADLIAHLQQGRLAPDTAACPVGSTQWAPLSSWSPFQGVVPPVMKPAIEPPPVVVPRSTGHSRVPPPLPEFASWVCVYALFVSPTLWLLSWTSCITTPPLLLEESPLFGIHFFVDLASAIVGLATTILLFIGALQLRKLRQIGVTLLTLGLGINLSLVLVHLFLLAAMFASAASDPEFVHVRPDDGSSADPTLLLIPMGLAAFIFEVVALIWLLRHGGQLSLRK